MSLPLDAFARAAAVFSDPNAQIVLVTHTDWLRERIFLVASYQVRMVPGAQEEDVRLAFWSTCLMVRHPGTAR